MPDAFVNAIQENFREQFHAADSERPLQFSRDKKSDNKRVQAAIRERTSARIERSRLRFTFYQGQAYRFWLPWLRYPWLVHRLTYRRTNRNLHVRGYKEEGTITTAFDIRVQNDLDRFHLVQDVVDRVPNLGSKGTYLKQQMQD